MTYTDAEGLIQDRFALTWLGGFKGLRVSVTSWRTIRKKILGFGPCLQGALKRKKVLMSEPDDSGASWVFSRLDDGSGASAWVVNKERVKA